MSTTSSDFFQCLICSSFFGSLWKVEKHVKIHNDDEKLGGDGTDDNVPQMGRRRGMLPIRKTTFVKCFVPIVRNQIDPEFLSKYAGLQSNDDGEQVSSDCSKVVIKHRRELKLLGVGDDVTIEDILNSSQRRPRRRGNLQARANIRRAAAILTLPEQEEDDGDDSDKDFIENLLHESESDVSTDDSCDFEDYGKKGRKRGRPVGNYSTLKKEPKSAKLGTTEHAVKKEKYKKPSRKWKWDGKEHPFKCEHCTHSFPKRIMLSFHLRNDHKDVVKMMECPVSFCKKTYVTYWMMRDHIRSHGVAERRELFVKDELKRLNTDSDKKPDMEILKSYGVLNCQFCLWSGQYSLEKLQTHKEKEHGKDIVLKCPCCEIFFQNSVLDLIYHVKTRHPSCLDTNEGKAKRKYEDSFKCDQCNSTFRYEALLKQHLKVHEKDKEKLGEAGRIFKCPSCDKAFKYKDNLKRHFTLHLENNPFTCDFPGCRRKCNSSYNLRRHKLLHSESYVLATRVNCPICNQSFHRKDKLVRHIRAVHKPEEMNGISTASKLAYRRKQVRLPPLRVRKYLVNRQVGVGQRCTPANRGEADTTSVPSLRTSENGKDSFLVKTEENEEIHLIDKILLDENGRAIHVKGERLSPQKLTPQQSSSKLQKVHDPALTLPSYDYNLTKLITSDPMFKKLDPNSSTAQSILSRRNNYNNGKSFTCKECGGMFSRAFALQIHLKAVHKKTLIDESTAIISQTTGSEACETTDGNNIQQVTLMCGKCAYVAKNSQDLDKHVKSIHYDDSRKHCCDICGILFKTIQRLQRHVREIHVGPRNYLCGHCKKAFGSKRTLQVHEDKVHINPPSKQERKQCPICFKYYSPRSIKPHLKRHSTWNAKEIEKLKCQMCGDVFSCNMALRRHIDCVHLGKTFNKMRKRKASGRRYPWLPSKEPNSKPPPNEWFKPLLQMVTGTESKAQETEAVQGPEEIEEGVGSIFGF